MTNNGWINGYSIDKHPDQPWIYIVCKYVQGWSIKGVSKVSLHSTMRTLDRMTLDCSRY